jgi:hypothetical protein
MIIMKRQIRRLLFASATFVAIIVAPSLLVSPSSTATLGQPCYNGIIPGVPWLPNCSMPRTRPPVRGAAPDATAIIACRNIPGCLSWYVNGP